MKIFIILLSIALVSCSSSGLIKDSAVNYNYTSDFTDGSDTKQSVTFTVMSNVVDSLKLREGTIHSMVSAAIYNAQMKLRNPRTFKFKKNAGMIFYVGKDSSPKEPYLSVIIDCIGANSFGVVSEFDLKGNELSK
jgi:hypothetical protein